VSYKRKLIEVALPLDAISAASAREKSIRHGHPSTLHLWWARRPLAAARAVLWASLVDDPSAHPDRFPTEEDQAAERRRLFDILERLVVWENSNNTEVLAEARAEIEASCEGELPNVLDPFCGGGTIPLEAQRLGLPAYGGDLNPVAVLISKALVEVPPRFADLPPVNPDSRAESGLKTWERAQGLAEDIGYYGQWVRDRALERIGHLYPKVMSPVEDGGAEANVIAWIWARTVRSPDPSWVGHVPLVRSWVLRKPKKNKSVIWAEPLIDRESQTVSYRIREGSKPPEGTVRRGVGTCVATGTPMPLEYVRKEAASGRMGAQMIAVVAEGSSGRVYLDVTGKDVEAAVVDVPADVPSQRLELYPRSISIHLYGLDEWWKLFTPRQLASLTAYSGLLAEMRQVVVDHARAAGLVDDGVRLRDGGSGAPAYADAVATYLGFAVDKLADLNNSLVRWEPGAECPRQLFARHAIPMVWDFAESYPLGGSSGSWEVIVGGIQRSFKSRPWPLLDLVEGRYAPPSDIAQLDAVTRMRNVPMSVVCTDPPYYDNIGYANLSDFFYVWLRRNLADVWPDETATYLTPKADELIANPYRRGGRDEARKHFESGMAAVLEQLATTQNRRFPATVFYAFKQQESRQGNRASTGWETFLQGLVGAGLQVTATWPVRTETRGRAVAQGTAALASSVVIAARPRPADAALATRREFVDALAAELPQAVSLLQEQAIAPVDMAQSAIGPGMEVFSRYAKVLEADGTSMRVRTALALINEVLEDVLSAEETEFDADTRWALTWYEQNGHDSVQFGQAETLFKAKNTSVLGIVQAGIAESKAGKVRLFTRDELDEEWDPLKDRRLTVWQVVQQLITRLDYSEIEAADLLRKVGGGMGDRARRLAYLLYQVADRKGRSEDAVAYNGLVRAWHDIERRAAARQGPVAQVFEGM